MWRLECDEGRQVWKFDGKQQDEGAAADEKAFLATFAKNKNSADRIYRRHALAKRFKPRAIPNDVSLPEDPLAAQCFESFFKGMNYYSALQDEDGHWPGDYGGPMFLMPGLVIASYVTNSELLPEQKREMIRYLHNHQDPEDGGWGLHIESHSTMFGTVMNYVALRLLGVKADDPMLEKPRAFIQRHGGALYTPSWGKFYLCVLGAMEWSGVNSLMPELWLLPEWLPLRPSHWWCHCRMVYLPMAYCYGHRVTGPITPLVQAIRREIYVEPYDKIEWWRFREQVRPIDRYWPGSWLLKIVFPLSNAYERVHLPFLRRKALDFILAYVNAEDAQTNYIDIGPVNKVINMLCCWHAYGEQSEQLRRHRERLPDYLWLAEDGMKMQGYNGSQLWDTAFSVRALCDSGLAPLFPDTLRRAYAYFDVCQVDEETPMREKWFRHVAKGAWPFSTKPHGWPISDCTSEALQAALRAVESQLLDREPLAPERLYDAVNVIIAFQNKDGGMATYENTRGPAFLEKLNPSEVFGDIMIDYSYVECTSACIQALAVFRKHFPEHRSEEVARTIARARQFLIDKQRPDGSWYGSWAVCFTYGAWFAIQGLIDAGEDPEGPVVRKGCDFLVSKQMPDGGWGESYLSCVTKEYTPHAESQVINTAWALLALMKAGYRDESVIERGVRLLLQKQEANGDWAQQGISGVFNGNCMITYTNYRNIFPLWAVGRYLCIKTGGAPLARRGRQVQVADASAEGKADEPGASPVHVNGKGKKGKARK